MNTLLLNAAVAADVAKAAELLQQGHLVAVPTETVYGLAADATKPEAVSQIFRAKGRPADHPLIVHLPDAASITQWAQHIPASAYQLAEAFWPGPLTLLLHKANHVDSCVTGGLDTIGLRVPAHPVLLGLLKSAKLAVAAPSANLYKKLSPTSAHQVYETMQGRIDAVLDGGDCEFGLESTIVSVLGDTVQVLRAGPISAEEISAVLGCKVETPEQHDVKVAGNVAAHYQPGTPLLCLDANQIHAFIAQAPRKIALLAYSSLTEFTAKAPLFWQVAMPQDAKGYGQSLYKQLYLADQTGADVIIVEQPPAESAWLAIHNRLMRAAYQEA